MNKPETIDRIGFGCVALTKSASALHALKLLETAYDNGITHFDTAPLYGMGYSEKILGAFVKGKRERVTITTKFGLGSHRENIIPVWMALPLNSLKKTLSKPAMKVDVHKKSMPDKLSYRAIALPEVEHSFKKSMQALKTDYLDYYVLHEGMPHFLAEGVIEFLLEKKAKGIIRHIGLGCDAINLLSTDSGDLENWDLLQYGRENLLDSNAVTNLFPKLIHIQHSIFKNVRLQIPKRQTNDLAPGAALALAVKQNPRGKILFSTSNQQHLVNNIKVFTQHIAFNEVVLKEILTDALH